MLALEAGLKRDDFYPANLLYQPVNCTRIIQNISKPSENNCGRNNRTSGMSTVCGSSRGNPLVNAEPAAISESQAHTPLRPANAMRAYDATGQH